MRNLEDYNVPTLKNSAIEFVVVARDHNGFRPIVMSENCGADLIGFANSSSYLRDEFQRDMDKRSDLDSGFNKMELKLASVEFDSHEGAIFFWKGARPSKDESKELKRIAEINLSAVVRELRSTTLHQERLVGFLQWHLGALVYLISNFSNQRRAEKRQSLSGEVSNAVRSFSLTLIISATLAVAVFYMLVSSEFFQFLFSSV